MTDRITMRKDDLLPVLRARAFSDDARVDFTAFESVAFTMVGPKTVTGAATSDAEGNLTYTWQSGDTDTVGTYRAVFRATDDTGKVQTFPTGYDLTIVIVG